MQELIINHTMKFKNGHAVINKNDLNLPSDIDPDLINIMSCGENVLFQLNHKDCDITQYINNRFGLKLLVRK